VAPPLRRTDCSPISDGAAALVIADQNTASSMARSLSFRSRAHANDFMALSRRDPIEFAGAKRAWARALDDANLIIGDLDLVETHDCFTIAELIEYEAMGLADPGQGHRIICEGVSEKSGRLPVNPSGGLKARGHPLGATGVSMHVMAAQQLTGDAGSMQIPGASLAGVFNMGGAAVTNYVSILERAR
jgi:acetyl-CoA C-acetyltransferase